MVISDPALSGLLRRRILIDYFAEHLLDPAFPPLFLLAMVGLGPRNLTLIILSSCFDLAHDLLPPLLNS